MKYRVILSCLLGLPFVSCASRSHIDPRAQTAWTNNSAPAYNQENPPTETDPGSAAVIGLASAGAAIASNPGYYKRNAITGRLICKRHDHSSIETPCATVDVVLTDAGGKEYTRAQVGPGDFVFMVKDKREYFLHIDSTKYRMIPPQTKALLVGDDILLHLFPR